MKLGKQLFILFCLVTLVPLGGLWFWLGHTIYASELASVRGKHLIVAKNLGNALQRYHSDLTSVFDFISENAASGIKVSHTRKLIQDLQFRHICIADYKTGVIINQVSPASARCPAKVPVSRFSWLKKRAIEHPGEFSTVTTGPDGEPLIFISRKIGPVLAIGAVRTDYFRKLAKAVAFGKKGHAAIVDQEGNILAHPNPDWVKQHKNIAGVSAVRRMMNGEQGVEQFYSPALKQDMIAGLSAVAGTGWGVMVPQPVSELYARAKTTRNSIFSVIMLWLIGAAFLAGVVSRMLSKPINAVILGTREVARGNNNIQLDVDDNWRVPREFQDLQERFNVMAKAVARYQEEERRNRETAEAETRHKMEYLANLGHELKTPLNSILGFSSVLKQAKPGSVNESDRKEFLGHIEKSASHMLGFINDLVDLNRLEMGIHQLQFEDIFIIDAIRFCQASHRKEIERRQIDIRVMCPDREMKVKADERSFNQILINLVSNAIKYSPEKSQIDICVRSGAGGNIEISVRDQGIGIPEDQIDEIMLPFKRVNDPNARDVQGTGLGLSIVLKLTRLLGWEFRIESEYGFGTTAFVTIPKEQLSSNENSRSAA